MSLKRINYKYNKNIIKKKIMASLFECSFNFNHNKFAFHSFFLSYFLSFVCFCFLFVSFSFFYNTSTKRNKWSFCQFYLSLNVAALAIVVIIVVLFPLSLFYSDLSLPYSLAVHIQTMPLIKCFHLIPDYFANTL